MVKVVEILIYTLKSGMADDFHSIMKDVSVPLHVDNGIDVVWYGPSLHSSDGYVLIRAFSSMASLHSAQENFYNSEAWRFGPREAIVSSIEQSLKGVVEMTEDAISGIRKSGWKR